MSRSYNQYKRRWDFPKFETKKWSNKTRRAYGKTLISEYTKAEDSDEVDSPNQIHKDSGKGDTWKWF